jgi:hypothetical protein
MHYLHEKGTDVVHTERSTKILSCRAGFVATFRALLDVLRKSTLLTSPAADVLEGTSLPAAGVPVASSAVRGWGVSRRSAPSLSPTVQAGTSRRDPGDPQGRRPSAPLSHLRGRRLATAALTVIALFLTTSVPSTALALGFEEHVGPPFIRLLVEDVHATRAHFISNPLKPEGSETHYRFEYATSSGTCNPPTVETGCSWTLAASGTVQPGEDVRSTEVHHLTPQTPYYARIVAQNASAEVEETVKFTTAADSGPEVPNHSCHVIVAESHPICVAPRTTSFLLEAEIQTNGAETKYRIESALAGGGPWTPVPGGTGSVTLAQDFANPEVELKGLTPETTYYVRVVATSENGTVSETTHSLTRFIHPAVGISSVTAVTMTSAHLKGEVYPGTYETHWQFQYGLPESGHAPVENSPSWTAVGPAAEGTIPAAQADEETHPVEGDLTGLDPGTVYYFRLFAENGHGSATSFGGGPLETEGFETAGPPTAETFATHAIRGEDMRALGYLMPHGLDTHYRFEYTTTDFTGCGTPTNPSCLTTPELDAGAGEVSNGIYPTRIVGVDLPGLQPGQTYHYRLLAKNEAGEASPGAGRTLAVPAAAEPAAAEACPNEALRTGPSAHLPDCRAYEQISPVDKEGAQEALKYGTVFDTGVLIGEDGEHVMYMSKNTRWGPGPAAGQAPYFFSRQPGEGWRMTAGAPQPEAGANVYQPQLLSPDLTGLGLRAAYITPLDFKAGPPGGPYATAATVPLNQAEGERGWVAASEGFGKLILEVEDHKLVEPPTATKGGNDLYEYSEGQLRQVNVNSGGKTIGSCGARIVQGKEESGTVSSVHAVSADGSRVFFEAVPGASCSEPTHLYMRLDGGTENAETLDLGLHGFLAANKEGTKVLLEKRSGQSHEVLLYDTESATFKPLFSEQEELSGFHPSKDLTVIYFTSNERLIPEAPPLSAETGFQPKDVYRYDIPAENLSVVAQVSNLGTASPSPDGRYYYFDSWGVAGLPTAKIEKGAKPEQANQFYRYDSAQGVVECVSCASPFDPEPKWGVNDTGGALGTNLRDANGVPKSTVFSANGDYAFFETPSALVPQDVNGEVPPEARGGERPGGTPSNDVYEWRRDGLDGCAHLQGCLSLITPGTGGFLVALLGTTDSGRDVFFYTSSQLLPQDNDTAGDFYDARIGGGFAEPTRPVECEGDACSTPFAAPNDLTPSSSTFQGAGNVLGAAMPEVKLKAKPKAKKTCKPKAKKKCKTKAKKKVGKKAKKPSSKRSAMR